MEYFLFEKLGARTSSDVKNFGFWNISVGFLKLVEHSLSQIPGIKKEAFQILRYNKLSWRQDPSQSTKVT